VITEWTEKDQWYFIGIWQNNTRSYRKYIPFEEEWEELKKWW
jgi:hypothetical protein